MRTTPLAVLHRITVRALSRTRLLRLCARITLCVVFLCVVRAVTYSAPGAKRWIPSRRWVNCFEGWSESSEVQD